MLVAAGMTVLTVIGVAYLVLARARVEADIEARADAAAREIEAFEQTGPATGGLPTPSSSASTGAGPTTSSTPPTTTWAATTTTSSADDPAVTAAVAGLTRDGTIAFVHRAPGDDYARVAVLAADNSRTLLDIDCLRVHIGGGVLTCLRPSGGLLGNSTFRAYTIEDGALVPVFSRDTGAASRTRASSDGRFVAYTAFVDGHSYLDAGGFATETIVVDRAADDDAWNLEDYDRPDDDHHDSLSGQFWGVSHLGTTDDFLVTYAAAGRMEIMRGDAVAHTVRPLIDDGTCPAVAPDGRTVVFKRTTELADGSTGFRLVALDLEHGTQWELDETRSVDDQVEWLDDDTVLYALERDDSGSTQPSYDVWSLDINGGEPELILPFADSPAVSRG